MGAHLRKHSRIGLFNRQYRAIHRCAQKGILGLVAQTVTCFVRIDYITWLDQGR